MTVEQPVLLEDKQFLSIAEKETHCGMCRVDFLGTGLCPAGKKHGFLAYWPQGRMQLYKALHEGTIQPTHQLIDIAESCTLCGICDKQCNFINQLRPEKVAKALKDYVEKLDKNTLQKHPEDTTLSKLRNIVGDKWATNDPIIIASYEKSIIPPGSNAPFYVVMPETTQQVADIIKLANERNLPYMARGNGTLLSFALTTILAKAIGLEQGIIIDVLRMKKIQVDPKSRTATIGAGVTGFEIQQAAYKHHLRANVAEAGAHVCSNVATTGICSTWSNYYGFGTDNYVDAELVNDEGIILHNSDLDIPNPYTAEHGFTSIKLTPPGIITELTIKLHPIFDDEETVLVPFEHLQDALDFGLQLAKRNIGLSLVVLSHKYIAEFICPTPQIAKTFETIIQQKMKFNYAVDVICRKHEKQIIHELAPVIIDQPMMRTLILGSPKLAALQDSEFMNMLAEEKNPLKALFAGPLRKHLEIGLEATPENIAKIYDKDLQDFFIKVYKKPEMTDLVWLHMFRIYPSRLMRQRMFIPRGGIIWTDEGNILDFVKMLGEVGQKHNLEHALGYIAFMEHGGFAQLEYDYFYDHNNPDAVQRTNDAIVESLERSLTMNSIISDLHFYYKGLYRKEHVLYPLPKAISQDEQRLFKQLFHNIIEGG